MFLGLVALIECLNQFMSDSLRLSVPDVGHMEVCLVILEGNTEQKFTIRVYGSRACGEQAMSIYHEVLQ